MYLRLEGYRLPTADNPKRRLGVETTGLGMRKGRQVLRVRGNSGLRALQSRFWSYE